MAAAASQISIGRSGGGPSIPKILLQGCLLNMLLVATYVHIKSDATLYSSLETVNRVGPLYFIFVQLVTTVRVIRAEAEAIWTPAVWLPFQSAVFYGFGPLSSAYGNEATREAMLGRLDRMLPSELLDTHLLSTVGVTSLLAGVAMHGFLRPKLWRRGTTPRPPILTTEHVAIAMLLVGLPLKHLVITPANWRMTNWLVPGVLTSLSPLADVGFALVAYNIARGDRKLRPLMVILWPCHLFLYTLSFAKTELILGLLLPAIGDYLGRRKLKNLSGWILGIAVIYSLSQPLVTFGRSQIWQMRGNINEATHFERAEIIGRYLSEEQNGASSEPKKEGWWLRLNYAPVQAHAMRAYDKGQSLDTLRDVWITFIPRILWPDKPLYISPAREFYRFVTGISSDAFLGLSIYGDLYWQFGWWGAVLGCMVIGLAFGAFTWRSLAIMRSREFIFLPVVLLALQAAADGPNRFVSSGIIAVFPLYFAYLFMVSVAGRLLQLLATRGAASDKDAGQFGAA